jgi:hypothetical protein
MNGFAENYYLFLAHGNIRKSSDNAYQWSERAIAYDARRVLICVAHSQPFNVKRY